MKFKYDVEYDEAERQIKNVLANASDLLTEPAARIGVEKIDDADFTVLINVWTNSHGFQDARMALNRQLMSELKPLFQKKPAV